jgi:hypothetical protein
MGVGVRGTRPAPPHPGPERSHGVLLWMERQRGQGDGLGRGGATGTGQGIEVQDAVQRLRLGDTLELSGGTHSWTSGSGSAGVSGGGDDAGVGGRSLRFLFCAA